MAVSYRLPLTALRTFEVAARLQSFKRAAEELCVTPTTVSNQIRQLERDWNTALFERKTRQLLLTDAGRSLSRVVSQAFDDISAEIENNINVTKKTVTLAIGPAFGSRWLIPRLNQFRRNNPNIELILHHSPRIIDARELRTDIAVDWGYGSWLGLEATHLLDIVYAPVLSPALIEKQGAIKHAGDILKFPIIHQSDRSEWLAWFALAGISDVVINDETIISDSNVIAQAAMDGQGAALGIFPLIQNEVDAGRLIRPLDTNLKPKRAYYLLTRPGAGKKAEVEIVCRWLENEAISGCV